VPERVAAVVGAAGAIGGAIVKRLCESGMRVVSLDLANCDVREPMSVVSAFAKFERLDVVVYAAGITRESVVWKLRIEDWDEIHDVNLRGAFLVLREAIPVMRKSGGGRIVLIGSINGSRGKFGTAAYSASKAGLIGLAKSVARETGRFGITVNVVEPGWVRTPMTNSLAIDIREAALAETLLGELAEPDDVAGAVAFLCDASHITGQVFRIDSGQLL